MRIRPWFTGLLGVCLLASCNPSPSRDPVSSVNVGILHSRSGTMALSENTVAEAERLAIEEINADGGLKLKGQRVLVKSIEEDGRSDPATFARLAEKLLDRQNVVAVFGGWTSSSRKAMIPIFEERGGLLFYPVQYEGQECSAVVVYGGSVPNQQSTPAVAWMLANKSKRLLLLGSDYIYPKTANRIIRSQVIKAGGTVLDELYLSLGSKAVDPLIKAIVRAKATDPVVVINTLNGDSNIAFFSALNQAGLVDDPNLSVLSLSVSEEEAIAIGADNMKGSYASWSYFQSLNTEASQEFGARFRQRYGFHRVINDPAEAGYSLVHLWAKAAEAANSTDPEKVRQALIGMRFDAPQGSLVIMPSQHLRKLSLLGRADAKGRFIVQEDFGVIDPIPWNPVLKESAGRPCDHSKTTITLQEGLRP